MLARLGGMRHVGINVALTALVMAVVGGLIALTGDIVQWLSLGAGVFVIISWSHIQKLVRPDFFALTLGSPFYLFIVIGCSASSCLLGTMHFWSVPYAVRTFDLPPALGSAALGGALAIGAVTGILAGGFAADRWQRRDHRAPLWVAMISVGGSPLVIGLMLSANNWQVYAAELLLFSIVAGAWAGPIGGVVLNHVKPRMRASAMSLYALIQILVSFAVGPYTAGKVSTLTGSLTLGVLSVCLLAVPALGVLYLSTGRLKQVPVV